MTAHQMALPFDEPGSEPMQQDLDQNALSDATEEAERLAYAAIASGRTIRPR